MTSYWIILAICCIGFTLAGFGFGYAAAINDQKHKRRTES